METISVFDAKAQFSKLIARAEGGDEIVILRHGRPVARLMPMPTPRPDRTPGWVAGFDVPDDFNDWAQADEDDWFDDRPDHSAPAS